MYPVFKGLKEQRSILEDNNNEERPSGNIW